MDVREKNESEKRLIDAKEGKKEFSAIAQPAEYKGVLHMVVPISEIDKLPTVDSVEVVRCKDCKYWGQDVSNYSGDDEIFCTNPDGLDNYAHPDDFCSYGERKDGDD